MDGLRAGAVPLLRRARDRLPLHLPQLRRAVLQEEVDQGDGGPAGDPRRVRGHQAGGRARDPRPLPGHRWQQHVLHAVRGQLYLRLIHARLRKQAPSLPIHLGLQNAA